MYYYIKQIRQVLQDNIPLDKIAHYLMGDVENIPEPVANGGFILITPSSSDIRVADSQRDEVRGQVDVIVGVQVRNNYQEEDYVTDHVMDCLSIMDGTDDNGQPSNTSVVGILRRRINNTWLNQDSFTIDYANQRDEAYIYAIKLTVTIYDQRNRNNS